MKPPHKHIVMKVELSFNSNPNDFYEELYKNRITHGFIRSELDLPDDIKIKLNGTFTRGLSYLDDKGNVCGISFKIQTALWVDANGKRRYVSIFPSFIKKHCPLSLHLLEHISSRTRRSDEVFNHIDDPEKIFDSEDPITRALERFEKELTTSDHLKTLNFRYTKTYGRSFQVNSCIIDSMRFKKVYELKLIACAFFEVVTGGLSLANSIFYF